MCCPRRTHASVGRDFGDGATDDDGGSDRAAHIKCIRVMRYKWSIMSVLQEWGGFLEFNVGGCVALGMRKKEKRIDIKIPLVSNS